MEAILESLAAEKLYPSAGSNLLDLEELSDGDFLSNVVRTSATPLLGLITDLIVHLSSLFLL